MSELKDVIIDLLFSGTSVEEIHQEVESVVKAYKCWKDSELYNEPREFFFNKKFKVTTSSWQVDEKHLRGNYTVLIDGLGDNADYFFCKNSQTMKEIIVTRNTLIYLMTVPDQDMEFIYVGCISGMGDYPCLMIKHDD